MLWRMFFLYWLCTIQWGNHLKNIFAKILKSLNSFWIYEMILSFFFWDSFKILQLFLSFLKTDCTSMNLSGKTFGLATLSDMNAVPSKKYFLHWAVLPEHSGIESISSRIKLFIDCCIMYFFFTDFKFTVRFWAFFKKLQEI